MRGNPGYAVELKDGRLGRTFHSKGMINGKVPVYLATEVKEFEDGFKCAVAYSDSGTLIDPKEAKIIGHID